MANHETRHLKAIKREHKSRPKMAVHGRSVKSLPSGGVLRIKHKRM